MLCDKKGWCKYQGDDGWSSKPTCELDYNEVYCQYQDRTEEQNQFLYEHADLIDCNTEKFYLN